MENCLLNIVYDLYKENNWKQILQLTEEIQNENAKNILWVWPNEENLKFIKNVVNVNGLDGIISIGCGSGLFEWLISQYTEFPVIGYEINKEWWTSKYCCPQFITLQFPIMPPKPEYLPKNYALLFCYFNNGPAFEDYIDVYKGKLVFIVGPGKGRGTHTNPEPFKPNLNDAHWKLSDFQEVRDTKDFIAAYLKL